MVNSNISRIPTPRGQLKPTRNFKRPRNPDGDVNVFPQNFYICNVI